MVENKDLKVPLLVKELMTEPSLLCSDTDKIKANCSCNYFFPISCFKCTTKICQNCLLKALSEENQENTHECFISLNNNYAEMLSKRKESLMKRKKFNADYSAKLSMIDDKIKEKMEFISSFKTKIFEIERKYSYFASLISNLLLTNTPKVDESIENEIDSKILFLEEQELKFKNADSQTKLEIALLEDKNKFLVEHTFEIKDLSVNSHLNKFIDNILEVTEQSGKKAINDVFSVLEKTGEEIAKLSKTALFSINNPKAAKKELNKPLLSSKQVISKEINVRRYSQKIENILNNKIMELITEESQSESSENSETESNELDRVYSEPLVYFAKTSKSSEKDSSSKENLGNDLFNQNIHEYGIFNTNRRTTLSNIKSYGSDVFEASLDCTLEIRRKSLSSSKWNKESVLAFIRRNSQIPLLKELSGEIDSFDVETPKTKLAFESFRKDFKVLELDSNKPLIALNDFVVGVKPGTNTVKIYDGTEIFEVNLENRTDIPLKQPFFPRESKFIQFRATFAVSGGQINDCFCENISVWTVNRDENKFEVNYLTSLEMKTPRKWHNMLYIKEKEVLVINGGLDAADKPVFTTEYFDFRTGGIVKENGPILNSPRLNSVLALANKTYLLTIGGQRSEMKTENNFNCTYEMLNIQEPSQKYKEVRLSPNIRLHSGSILIKQSEKVFCIFGGEFEGESTSDLFELKTNEDNGVIEQIEQKAFKNAIPSIFTTNSMYLVGNNCFAFDSKLNIVKYSLTEKDFFN